MFYQDWKTGIREYKDYIFAELEAIRENMHKYAYVCFCNYPPRMQVFFPHPEEYKSLTPVEATKKLTKKQAKNLSLEQLKREELEKKYNSSYVKLKDLEIPWDSFNINFLRTPDLIDFKAFDERRSYWYPNLRDFIFNNLSRAPTYFYLISNHAHYYFGCRIDVLIFALNKWLNRGKTNGIRVDFDKYGKAIISKGHNTINDDGEVIEKYGLQKEFSDIEINKNIDEKIAQDVKDGKYYLLHDNDD